MIGKKMNSDLLELLTTYTPDFNPILGKNTRDFAALLAGSSPTGESGEPDIKAIRLSVAEFLAGKALPYPYPMTSASFVKNEIAGISCYILKHEDAKNVPTLVMFYGGGFCLNTMGSCMAFMANVAAKLSCNIILPDSPLAPETKAREMLSQVNVFIKTLFNSFETYGISENFILMGWSSGANIAITAALNLQNEAPILFGKISKLVLLSPWIDLSMRTQKEGPYQTQQNADTIAAGAEPLTQMSTWYLPKDATGGESEFCPATRSADELKNLPFTTVITGGSEVLFGDSVLITHALKQAGTAVQLVVLQGQTHNYLVLDQLSKDGVFVPDLIQRIITDGVIENMVGEDGFGLELY